MLAVGNNEQWAGTGRAGIKRDANDSDGVQNLPRRLAVVLAVLDRPRAEAVCVDSLLKCDRRILMPGHSPVGVGCLVKDDRADDPGARPGRVLDDLACSTPFECVAKPRLTLEGLSNAGATLACLSEQRLA